jgi:hypothetical protein
MVDDEYRLTNLENDLLTSVLGAEAHLTNPQAKRHLRQGLYRRLLMMKESRFQITQTISATGDSPLDAYTVTGVSIHLNSYYLHARGALDNLAWLLNYEFGLLADVHEDSPRGRPDLSVFGSRFVRALRVIAPPAATVLENNRTWEQELKALRDPIAHRIPLYAVPSIASEAESREILRLHELADEAFRAGEHHRGIERLSESSRIGRFVPAFVESSTSGFRLKSIPAQIARDLVILSEVSNALLKVVFDGVQSNNAIRTEGRPRPASSPRRSRRATRG